MPSEMCPYVLRDAISNGPGSTVPGRAATMRSPSAKLRAPQTIPRGSDSPTSTWQKRMGFLNSVSSSMCSTRPITSGPVISGNDSMSSISKPTRTKPASISSVVADQVGSPARSTSVYQDCGARIGQSASFIEWNQCGLRRRPAQAAGPNGRLKRTSPSTMSRMSEMSLRNCRVRSSPIPNANPE